jgi:MtN3 and saliva related transmembrane protein
MQQFIAILFGLGLVVNGLLFLPQAIALWRKKSAEGVSLLTFGGFNVLQAIGILHGIYQHDRALILGMSASFVLCGLVTGQTLLYRLRAPRP